MIHSEITNKIHFLLQFADFYKSALFIPLKKEIVFEIVAQAEKNFR